MQNQLLADDLQTENPLSDVDLVRVLRTRAVYAREEGTGTAIGDALHFEAAADAIERLLRFRPQMGGAA